ncbi:MAG: CARDB domain-containing protein, partial [Anaerolineae bacterium]
LWNVHAFILSEGPPPDWGADIPPGMVTPALIQWRNLWDCDDMDIFKQQIHDFRQWMANHNERDKPLIISEYGILMPSSLCDGDETHYDPYCGYKPNGKPNGRPYDYPRVTAFMQATFDYFLGVDPDGIDPALGYPDDGNRLVQAWNWYSLNEDWMYNGNLFHSGNKQITALGVDFKNYATPLKVDYKDLLPWELSFEHTPDLFAGDLVTVTISSQVFNMGNEAAQDVLVRFWDGEPGVGTQLGGDQVVSNVPSRYQGAPTAAITWTTMAMDVHDMYVEVNPAPHSITESVYANNILSATLDFKSDLTVNAIAFDPPNPLLKDGQEVTITVSGQVQNVGHLAAVSVTVRFWDGDPDGSGTQIGSDQIIATDPADPLGQDEVATAQVTWTTGVSGTHQIYVRVDPDNAIGEIDEDNNQKMETIWVAADRIFLPLILKGSSGVSGASVTSDPRDFLKIKLPTPTPTA